MNNEQKAKNGKPKIAGQRFRVGGRQGQVPQPLSPQLDTSALPPGPPAEPAPGGATSNKVPWNAWAGLAYAVVAFFAATQVVAPFAVYFGLMLMGNSSKHALDVLQNAIGAQFVYVLLGEALTFAAIWWFVRFRGSRLRAIGWRRLRLMDPVYTLAGFLVYIVAYALLLAAATHLFPSLNIDQKQQLGFQDPIGNTGLVLTFLSLVVLPPIVEETVFRGFIFTGLRNNMRPLLAGLLTSALFATAHLEFGSGQPLLWVAALDTFTLSLVLCYLRQKTDSLWPGILLHALKNAIAFISLYLIHTH